MINSYVGGEGGTEMKGTLLLVSSNCQGWRLGQTHVITTTEFINNRVMFAFLYNHCTLSQSHLSGSAFFTWEVHTSGALEYQQWPGPAALIFCGSLRIVEVNVALLKTLWAMAEWYVP